jgi:DNA-binding MarR family transcriptional regulator
MDWFDDFERGWELEYSDLDTSDFPPLVRLARLGVLIDAFQHDVLQPFELTPSDYGVLASLRRAGAPYALKPSQLYSRLNRSSGGMTKILKRLEEAGLVERTPDPDDGRGTRVTLTARGRSLQDRVFHAFIVATSSLMGPLNASQKRAADDALGEMLAVFEGRTQTRIAASTS